MTAALFSLDGKTALVTGAGRGIGRALALGLARAGADLVLLGRPHSQKATAATVSALGRRVRVVDLDLSDPAQVRATAARLATEEHVDVLVNNAGIIDRRRAAEIRPADWSHVLDVNLNSLFFLTQQLAGPMVSRGSGKVINVASLMSFQGGLNVASYAATKHAIAGLTRALSNEWAGHGVQVNAIAPGYIVTDNTQPLREDPNRLHAITDRIPAGRWGEPDDLVGAAVFLASGASAYVTGHVLVVDGGWTAR
ncbi:2-deoxy-D-gluconate 3-dehydrogenase [Thermocatellispora tengchongensis]|uniref:2-deoxy-D-gluconate 3-dehydrogenase n=1 Tax=Thermocatellispora tengchongensis TaxID=1073253 RepID=A0A840PCW4_9ACTN|nr:SDR family oxidoreductase [Thermocatellispora tengchongensis]MBB5137458.1 2-deoxy-D-gluconate 3-dehydrogenase [Thermocatellispora tengchongensis]